MNLTPDSWGSVLSEVNHCHGKGSGHPCDGPAATTPSPTSRLERLAGLLPEVTTPGETKFLFPDGRRRGIPQGDRHWTHEGYLGKVGFNLAGAGKLGVVRVLHPVGIEVSAQITSTQARIIVDDFIEGGFADFAVDITSYDKEGGGVTSHPFSLPMSPSTLRSFINARVPEVRK